MRQSRHVCFGDVTYRPGGICGPRVQADYQLVVILTGTAQIETGDSIWSLSEGTGLLLKPGRPERIEFDPDDPTRHTWCSVHPSLVTSELAGALDQLAAPGRLTATTQRLMECGLKAPSQTSLSNACGMIDHLGLALLAHWASRDEVAPGEFEPEAVLRTVEFVDRHFREAISLTDLARAAGTTGSHLIRIFRKYRGITPTRHLWKVRTQQGIERLTHTGLSVSEIADRTGFANPFHFSRMIRKATGRSPREFRKDAWGSSKRVTRPGDDAR